MVEEKENTREIYERSLEEQRRLAPAKSKTRVPVEEEPVREWVPVEEEPVREWVPVEEGEEPKRLSLAQSIRQAKVISKALHKQSIRQAADRQFEILKAAPEIAASVVTGGLSFLGGLIAQPTWGFYKQWKEGFTDLGIDLWDPITKTIAAGKPAKEFFHKYGSFTPKNELAIKTLSVMMYPFAQYDKAATWFAKAVTDNSDAEEAVKYATDVAMAYGVKGATSLVKSSFKSLTRERLPKASTIVKIINKSKKVPDHVKENVSKIDKKTSRGELEGIFKEYVKGEKGQKQGKKLTLEEENLLEKEGKQQKIDGQEYESTKKAYAAMENEFAELNKPSVKKAHQKLKRLAVDTSGNIKNELLKKSGLAGKEAVMHFELAKGSSGKANSLYMRAATEVYGGLSLVEIKMLDHYIASVRMLMVKKYHPRHKLPGKTTIKGHQAVVKSTPKHIQERGGNFFDLTQMLTDELLNAKVISKALHKQLSAHAPYSPIKFIQHLDPSQTPSRGRSIPSSGIHRLKEGSYQSMETNSRALLADMANRVYGRIDRNSANQSAYALAKQIPDNGIFKAAKIIRTTKQGKPVFERTPAGHEVVDLMMDGKERRMFMERRWAEEWISADPMINETAAQMLGWFSGSKILKPMATGLNPEFALTNFPRDLAHIWFVTNEYSPHLPIAVGQMGLDLLATARDAFSRTGAWGDYLNQGGGMQWLTHQGRLGTSKYGSRFSPKVQGKLDRLQERMGYMGETSEIWARLAMRRRAMRNGKPPLEATWLARTYLDFNQSGSFIKAVDAGIPYINAGVQATRGIFRAVGQRPLQTTYKVAQLGGLSSALYLANRYGNPEAWKSVSEHDKYNNFIFTTGESYRNKSGDKRHLFVKVAKDPGQKAFAAIFEALMGKYIGDTVDADKLQERLVEILKPDIRRLLPPSLKAFAGYMLNKDFWTKRDIWSGRMVEPSEEYTSYTHPALIKAGKLTGWSPDRMRYWLQQFFTSGGNIYTSVTGEGLRRILGELPEEHQDRIKEEMMVRLPFARRAFDLTSPDDKEQPTLRKIKIEENTRRHRQDREIDKIALPYFTAYHDDGVRNHDLYRKFIKYIKTQPSYDQDRLFNRWDTFEAVFRLPNRKWWMGIISISSPEAKALAYWTKWRTATKGEKDSMKQVLARLSDRIGSERFHEALNELKWEDRKKNQPLGNILLRLL